MRRTAKAGPVPHAGGFKTFLVSYKYQGADWNIEIPAQSLEDAQRRVSALARAKCEGQAIASLPVPKTLINLWRGAYRQWRKRNWGKAQS